MYVADACSSARMPYNEILQNIKIPCTLQDMQDMHPSLGVEIWGYKANKTVDMAFNETLAIVAETL